VTGSNGLFQVTGTHTYAVEGNYAVHVVVVDQYGDTLSTTGLVSVVRDPLAAYGNTLEATAGVALNNAVVGFFTDANTGDKSGTPCNDRPRARSGSACDSWPCRRTLAVAGPSGWG
jgi:gamma-glutamyltranspeptidase